MSALKLDNPNLKSSQALGSIDTSKTLENANFGSAFSGLNAGKLGTFFIGEGEGVVRIDYDITVDTVNTLIQKVNSSDANVYMFRSGERPFCITKQKHRINRYTVHESSSWDAISSNKGAGNVLELMGLASPKVYQTSISPVQVYRFPKELFKFISSGNTSYWQALEDGVIGDPSLGSGKWRQVIQGVGRTINSEIGEIHLS